MADQRPQWVLIDLTMSPPPSNVLSTDMTPIVKSEMTVDPPPSTASSHTSSRSTIVNPYAAVAQRQAANKFIGGAERARLEARKKKKPTRILRPGEEQKQSDSVLSKKINILERFFAALLRSSAADFLKASEGSADAAQLWTKICHRVSLDVPTQAIQAVYEDAATHFEVRAALVLEEARHAISQSLQAAWRQRRQSPMFLTAHLTEKSNAHGHVKITFSSRNNFTIQELHHIRPGAIFQCISRDEQSIVQNAVLGVVVTGNREQVEKKKCFTCLFFRCDDLPVRIDDCEFAVTAITQLVTELRCFEAMTHQPASISFLHQLLGKKGSTHTHFEDGEEFIKFNQGGARNSWKENSKDKKAADTAKSLPLAQDFFLPRVKPEKPAKPTYFHLPPLNKAQEDAATAYLRSEQNTITLVQGPPGTGKTTLLVSIICRYLMESMENGKEYRLLVSAPTNKAISVLATRFLAAMSQDCPVPCNAIMVGDAEKLLVDERSSGSSETQNLKSIFLYSWIPNVIEGYKRIKSYFLPRYSGTETVPTLLQLALQLQARLTNSLPYLSADILDWTGKIVTALDTRKSGGAAHDIVSIIEKLLKELKEMPSDAVWTQVTIR